MFSPSKYIGIPFRTRGRDRSGIDCWGLVKLVYLEELGIELPEYYIDAFDVSGVEKAIGSCEEAGWKPVESPKILDVALMSLSRHTSVANHVALHLGGGKILHASDGSNSVVTRIDRPPFNTRVLGFISWVNNG